MLLHFQTGILNMNIGWSITTMKISMANARLGYVQTGSKEGLWKTIDKAAPSRPVSPLARSLVSSMILLSLDSCTSYLDQLILILHSATTSPSNNIGLCGTYSAEYCQEIHYYQVVIIVMNQQI